MKPHVASLLHAVVLIAISAWGYLSSDTPSFTALIPAAFGVLLLLCVPGVKKENKVVAHIAVGLTAVLAFALVMPLRGAIGRSDSLAIARVSVMLAATAITLVVFVRSFINARKMQTESEQT